MGGAGTRWVRGERHGATAARFPRTTCPAACLPTTHPLTRIVVLLDVAARARQRVGPRRVRRRLGEGQWGRGQAGCSGSQRLAWSRAGIVCAAHCASPSPPLPLCPSTPHSVQQRLACAHQQAVAQPVERAHEAARRLRARCGTMERQRSGRGRPTSACPAGCLQACRSTRRASLPPAAITPSPDPTSPGPYQPKPPSPPRSGARWRWPPPAGRPGRRTQSRRP